MKLNKLLGTGFSGSTYKIKKNGKFYAVKIQHILKKDILNKKSQLWNEVKFYKYVSEYYPLFKKFYSYEIIEDCKFKKNNQSIGLKVSNKFQKKYKKLQDSNFCIQFITSYEENVLETIINKLNEKEIYSLFLHLLFGIKILQKRKYTHNDFNYYNITYNKTKKKSMKIIINKKEYTIPIFNYIFTIIDYGGIEHISFIKTGKCREKYINKYKKQDLKNLIRNINMIWINENKFIKKKDVKYMKDNLDNLNKIIKYFQDKIQNS